MIRHFVFFRVKPTVSKEAIETAFNHLFSLKNKLTGILNIAGGACHFHEGKGKGTVTHGFSIDFANEKAYEAFLNEPVTHPTKACIVNISVDGYEGLFGFNLGEYYSASTDRKYKIQAPRLRLTPRGSIY